jgi:methionyl-tRNA formyltransferase
MQHFLDQAKVTYEVESDTNTLYCWLQNSRLDVCFVLGYNKLIKIEKLKGLSTPLFNIHFGTLPAYKGPTPIFWQLKHGCDKIGLAIHRLTEKFDEGAVVWRKEIDNQPYFTYKLVEQQLSNYCVEGVFFILGMIERGIPLLDLPATTPPSYYSKPRLQDVFIRWDDMSAVEICNLIRACNPWNKGAITSFKGQELKLMDAQVEGITLECKPGEILESTSSQLRIGTVDGKSIAINMLYYNDTFIPAYLSCFLGVVKGEMLG